MGATTQVTDFSDLFTDLMNRVRTDTSLTATANQAKRYINIALHDMQISFGETLPWWERHATLVTQPKYTTGTLVATIGSTTLTGTSTAWKTANDHGANNVRPGGKIVIDGSQEVYEIDAVASDTSLTMLTKFIDATTTASTYVYFEDEYALASNFGRPIDQQSFFDAKEIELIGGTEFRRRYPRNNIPGRPMVATIVQKEFGSDTVPVRKLRFFRPPETAEIIPYNFVSTNLAVTSAGAEQAQLVNDSDEPVVPLRYRHVIVLNALYHWYRDKLDDDRSGPAREEYQGLMLRISADQEIGRPRPQFAPRISHYGARARNPYRGGARGRYTTGTSFDRGG